MMFCIFMSAAAVLQLLRVCRLRMSIHGTTLNKWPFSELCSGWVHRVFLATGFWHVGPDNQCENQGMV